MAEEYGLQKHFAVELGMDRSHARRYVLKLGITPQKRGRLTRKINTRSQWIKMMLIQYG
ncbi:MAG: hypothetical protein KF752_14585 [Pirellulaceae bacterium]|nr:hypothetical protein [Pirellulaceae bacterium]